jgi:predicted negative regulator of RcsB-dependent stress response
MAVLFHGQELAAEQESTAQEALEIFQAPTVPNISSFTDADYRWRLTQAENALAGGLPYLAKTICQNLEKAWEGHNEPIPPELSLCHIDALIALGQRQAAEKLLTSRQLLNPSARSLRLALIYEQERNTAKSQEALQQVRSIDLDTNDWFWYYLIQAFVAEEAENEDLKEEFLERAKDSIETPMHQILWDLFFLQRLQLDQQIDDAILEQLREKSDQFYGGQLGFQYARQYILALQSMGQTSKALEVAEKQLSSLRGTGSREEDLFRLLIGHIAGASSSAGADNLRRLVASGSNREWQSLALYLLAQHEMENNREGFIDFLDVLIDRKDEHPLLDTILYLRAQAAQLDNKKSEAAELAHRILEQFPGSSLLRPTIYLLARNAWEDNPQRLRDTAELLLRYRNLVNSIPQRARIQVLLGDVYFLNKDYAAARNAYSAAIRELRDENMRSLALFQLVQTYLITDDIMGAIDALNQEEWTLPNDWRWRIHWNLLISMRQKGMQREAFQRINHLLAERSLDTDSIPIELRWRFQWLKADLSLIDGNPDETLQMTAQLLDSLEQQKDQSNPTTYKHLVGHTLLIRAQAFFQENRFTEAMENLALIQQLQPTEEIEILALLLKARFHEARNQIVESQAALQEIADRFPSSQYAPLALFEAAAKAEQRGIQSSFDQAIALLERIVRNYPEERKLRYQARLRQGEILRKMSQFSSAAGIYRTLMQQARNDLEQYTAQLHLAYCLIALGNLDRQNMEEARSYLERIRNIRTLPADLRAEAGFQEGFVLRRLGENQQAIEVFNEILHEFLQNAADPNALGPQGRYWAVRSVLELIEILEAQGLREESLRLYTYLRSLSLPGLSNLITTRMERLQNPQPSRQETPTP